MKKRVSEIEKYELFQELFPIDEKIKDRIKQDMSENGFDENQPIVQAKWSGMDNEVCVDGHTRIQAAEELGIDEVPTVTYSVATEQDAFELALKRQVNRRNLTDAEIFQCVETISDRYGNPPNGGLSCSVQEMADKLGISKRKAERTLRVLEQGTPETKIKVRTGVTSLHKAEKALKSSSSEPHPSSEKRKKRSRQSRTVEIDPAQWEQLERLSELTDADIEDMIYEALEEFLTPRETDEQASEEETEETEAA